MRRPTIVWFAVCLFIALVSPAAVAQDAPNDDESWIVVLAEGADAPLSAFWLSRQAGGSPGFVYEHALNGFSFEGSAQAAAALAQSPAVERVHRSGVYELTEQGPNGVLRIGAWAANQIGHNGRMADGTKVRVAVLDSGVMANHPDLVANVVPAEGKNCVIGAPDPTNPADDHGHGTHVTGTVAAALNGSGVIGVATDAAIAAVKVVNSQGIGQEDEILCGLNYVAALAADGTPTVVNMSLGEERVEAPGCSSTAAHTAICNLRDLGVTVVAAMGNDFKDGSNFYPAAYPEVIGVSAFVDRNAVGGPSNGCQFYLDVLNNCDESLANFTNFGAKVAVTAPGVAVYSTTNNGGHGVQSGTSMASPHVAGVAALVLAADPTLSADEVRTIIQETGECPDGATAGAATCAGHGQWQMSDLISGTVPDPDGIPEPLVNALAAAEAALDGAVDETPPVITLNPPDPQFVTVGNGYTEFGATALDERDGDVSADIVINASAVNTAAVGTYSVTYDVADSSGNAAQAVRTVEVVATADTTPPVIALNGPNPQSIPQDDPYVELGATAIDSFEGDVSGAIVIDASAVNTAVVGTYQVTYDVADSLGNASQAVRTVEVTEVDRTAPVITLLGDNPQQVVQGFLYQEQGATALDNFDGDVSASIVIDASAVNTAVVGSYQVIYDVADSSGNAAQATRTVDVVAATPATAYDVDFSALVVSSFGNQDVSSTMSIEDGGASLRITGNAWKKVHIPTVVTPNTVLEFDFSSTSEGEVHGIGFDNDENLSENFTFKLYGTQNWGLQDFDDYVAPAVTHYKIPVGSFYTGAGGQYLVFAADHDVSSPSAESFFSNVRVYEEAPLTSYTVDFSAMSVQSYGGQDATPAMSIEDGGASLRLTGNSWKKIPVRTEITAETTLEFDFTSSAQGEVHGIGFDTDQTLSSDTTFKVYGTQSWGLTDYDNYSGSATTHYSIPVGQFFTGTYDFLVFVNDHDVSSPTAESLFSNVQILDGTPADVTPPVMTLVGPDPQVVEVFDSYVEQGATATDDVDGDLTASVVIDASAVDTSTLGSYPVTYDVTDSSGNAAAQVTRTVNVADTTAPVISLSGPNPQQVTRGDTYVELGATASDNYDGDLTASVVIDASAVDTSTLGSYPVTYNVTDSSGNAATQVTRTVNVVAAPDVTPPVITLNGPNPQEIEVNSGYVELGATATDDVDGDLTASIVTDASAVDTSTLGSYPVTYDVTDSSGNTAAQVTRTVNVVDTTAPVITLSGPNPQVINQGDGYTELGATASDNYDGDLTASVVIDASAVDTSTLGSYPVTYNVTDSSGNAATQVTRTVNVADTTAPVITLVGDDPQVIEVHASYVELGATASDNYDGDLTASIVTDASAVDTSTLGSYPVTYDVTDSSGNTAAQVTRTVNVVDTTAPVITLSGPNPQVINQGDGYTELGATASDNYDGDLTASVVIDASAVNTAVAGSYPVTYNVTDTSGNAATQGTRTVNVVDTTAPVITLTGPNPQVIEVNTGYSELGATATDDVDGDLTASIVTDSSAVNTAVLGSYPVTYNVTDSSGNPAIEVTRTVNVVDTTAPVITLVGDDPQVINQGDPYTELGATASDNYDGDLTASIVTNAFAVDTSTVGSYPVTYNVTDSSGNAATEVTRTVNVVAAGDVTPPVITLNGPNPQEVTQFAAYVEQGATATDDVDGDLTASIVIDASAVNTAVVGSYPVTYNVADSAGNPASEVTRTVNVVAPSGPLSSYVVDFAAMTVTSFGNQDRSSLMSIEDDGASLRVTGNGWKKIQIPTAVSPDTVLEFDFSSSAQGEIHGIGFDTNQSLSAGYTFRLYGTQNWGLDDFASYGGSGVTHYRIPVGAFYTGTFEYLVFANDHDVSSPDAESFFSNVQVYEAAPLSAYGVDFSAEVVSGFGNQDTASSTASVEDGGASLRITGNAWKKIALRTVITPNTVLEFDFSSSAQGEVHGIGFDTNQSPSSNRSFKLYGTQNWGNRSYATYVAPGVTHYTIPVGQFFTGTFDFLVFINDHDVSSPTGESLFSNVQVYETTP